MALVLSESAHMLRPIPRLGKLAIQTALWKRGREASDAEDG
jgi:hypothetical protein